MSVNTLAVHTSSLLFVSRPCGPCGIQGNVAAYLAVVRKDHKFGPNKYLKVFGHPTMDKKIKKIIIYQELTIQTYIYIWMPKK